MKRNAFIGVIALGAVLVVFSGISQAGGWMHQSSGETKSMKQGSNTPALEPWPWSYEYSQALETGTLPGTDVKSESSESDMARTRAADSEPKEQIGGIEFRKIDVGS
ncbi:MAG TPA: hypothetical protein VJ386_08140 [Candidatus Deferrimicrobiaceae bacterium]|jgi:hypothetical protein|nr:hypothetical protein [Candidatus Deferrimicrobiaceae bacterium]